MWGVILGRSVGGWLKCLYDGSDMVGGDVQKLTDVWRSEVIGVGQEKDDVWKMLYLAGQIVPGDDIVEMT